jgi:hypothetical protein
MAHINHLPQLVHSLAVKNLLHLFAVVWLSVIVLFGLFSRPEVIKAVGAQGWSLGLRLVFALLFFVWISLVFMWWKGAQFFAVADPLRFPAKRNGTKAPDSCSHEE